MSSVIRNIITLLVCILFQFAANNLFAQTSPYYSISYSDSVQKEANSEFVYNNVTITNVYSKPMILFVSINMPDGWKLLSSNELTIELQAGESYELPLAFSKTANAPAAWTPAKIQVQLRNGPPPSEYTFYIKAKAKSSYYSDAKSNDITLTAYQETINLKLYIKNTGNIEQHYRLYLKNKFFDLNNKEEYVTVPAGKDTIYSYPLKLSRNAWKDLKSEEIKVILSNDSNRTHLFTYYVRKVSTTSKVNESKYVTLPVILEGGIVSSSGRISYYGGITGIYKINNNSNINFQYKTKQLGDDMIGAQHDFVSVIYNYKNLQVEYGSQISDAKLFNAIGQGIKFAYKWGKNTSLSLYGIKHYKDLAFSNSNDVAGGVLQYSINKIKVRQEFAGNFDDVQKAQSYLLYNTVEVLKSKSIGLSLTGGIGFDHYTRKTYDEKNDVPGGSLGYNFFFSKSQFNINSSASSFDDNYPGNFKGYSSNAHTISYGIKNSTSINLFYQSLYSKNIGLKDSIFNTNPAILNTSNYGISTTWHNSRMSLTVGTGILKQIGVPFVPPVYQSYNLDYSYRFNKGVFVRLNTLSGNSNTWIGNNDGNRDLSVFMQRVDITTHFGGINLYYSKMPDNNLIDTAIKSVRDQGRYFETMNLSAYIDLHFYHKALNTRFQYNVAQTNNVNSNSFTTTVQYQNKRHDYGILFSAYVPASGTSNSGGANLTFRKGLDIPLVTQRKYYDLRIVLYTDDNSNGQMDSNEVAIKNVEIKINDYSMLTDEKGTVLYENIPNGNYKLDFTNVRGLKGLMPTNGIKQTINVNGSTVVKIPFKRSNYVYGRINVDFRIKELFTLDNFKITATDTAGNVYSTVTDEAGEYYLNLPASQYIVSLNPAAFDENFKPVQLSYNVDLVNNEEANVVFKVVQKKREANIMQVDLK